MNKLLSIAYMALTLCAVSTPSAADDVIILGTPAKDLIAESNDEIIINPQPIHIAVLNISEKGIKVQAGVFSEKTDTTDHIKSMFAQNTLRLVTESFTTTSASNELEGSIIGRNQISISAEKFRFPDKTIFGTNGQTTLHFMNPHSLIKSITLASSNITVTSNGKELHIGSVWGNFDGTPSSDPQIIYLAGYPSIEVVINLEALAELLSKK
jgi:hypothetical protein